MEQRQNYRHPLSTGPRYHPASFLDGVQYNLPNQTAPSPTVVSEAERMIIPTLGELPDTLVDVLLHSATGPGRIVVVAYRT